MRNEVQLFLLQNEISIMKKLQNSTNINLLKLHDVIQTQNNTYIITELCNQGDLKQLLDKNKFFEEQQALKILKHILNGYRELAKNKIIHRDIKPANILINNGIPKISDFGFSKEIDAPPFKYLYNVGTPIYMSPQSLDKNEYNQKSDIWAIGVLYYELLYGMTPWIADNEQQLRHKINTINVQFPTYRHVSNKSKNFILDCLKLDEQQRCGLEEIDKHALLQINLNNKIISKNLNNELQQQQQCILGIQDGKYNKMNQQNKNYTKQQNTAKQKYLFYFYLITYIKFYLNFYKNLKKLKSLESSFDKQIQQKYKLPKSLNKNSQLCIKNSEKMEKKKDEKYTQNDKIILSQINLCRFLYKMLKLAQQTTLIQKDFLKEKIIFLISKNLMIHIQKLNIMVLTNMNTYKLDNWSLYSKSENYQILQIVIKQYNKKYSDSFNIIWEKLNKNDLDKDQKFNVIFDENFVEFETFYIILISFLRYSIRQINFEIKNLITIDQNLSIPDEYQQSLVLNDYLITYFQLTNLMLEHFKDYKYFAESSKIEQIAQGQPVKLNKQHFKQIQNKIANLEI
ncbi:protein kinase domain protein [Ichthyophthirius multifiliis]|uniref:Protein kinase domain protein n=1 Tax=Ichthyophthirius multifiliis TaxID=5932 RepID=G0QKB7_ICHMU|nr:protein kinase domain protein [Ichthyophthirius multifiliis]EGR34339.1 protein kinase domain protein [Ichthyophthirius multifiliis]|eukprot:XP_004039643.1 protein kinase domain protein [Ichthyophthirius multifiliis]